MQAQFLDLYRASLKTATEFMKTSLEQTERFQQQQLQMVKSALEESSRSGSQASEVKSLDDIVALNSKLAGNQLERVAEFWSNWWRVAGDAQKSMIDQMQSQLGQAKERVRTDRHGAWLSTSRATTVGFSVWLFRSVAGSFRKGFHRQCDRLYSGHRVVREGLDSQNHVLYVELLAVGVKAATTSPESG